MFNLIDFILIVIIVLSAFIGYKRGLVKTVVSLISFFVAIGIALLFYKPLAVILTEKTEIDDWIIERIVAEKEVSGDVNDIEAVEVQAIAEETQNKEKELSLENTLEELPEIIVSSIEINGIKENAKKELAQKVSELIMKLMSLIIIFVVVKVTLFISEFILNGVMKLPVLKQINEVLGMSLGAVIGFVEMYLALAAIAFISSIADISFVVEAIKASALASVMFDNNIIIRLLS